jgi:hypothetical protein
MRLLLPALLLTLTTSAFADSVCSDENSTKCATVGTGAGVSAASGIYAAKKYSEANSIEKQYTQRVYSAKSDKNFKQPIASTSSFTNGDKITIAYSLSEAENREYHIKLMLSNASSARSQAATYGALALSATTQVPETTTDSNGNVTTTYRTEPDYAARATYAALATNSLAEAADYESKANDARRGGPVPTYELNKVVDSKSETVRISSEFMQERIDRGGTILHVDRLPVERFNMVKSVIGHARGGVVGAAVGVGFAAEEAISGQAAKKITGSGYAPKISYGSR